MSTRDDPSNDDISGERFETPTNIYDQVEDERQGDENEHNENKTSCSPGSNENVEDQTADATPVENDVDEGNSIDHVIPFPRPESSPNSDSSSSDSDSDEYHTADEGSASDSGYTSSNDSDGLPERDLSEADNEEYEGAGECEKRGEEHKKVEKGVNEAGTATVKADSEEHETVEVSDGPQKDAFHLRGSESDSGRQDDDNYHPKVISTNSDSSSSDSDSEEYFTADEGSASDSGYISSNDSDGLPEDADGQELLGEGDASVGLTVFIPPALGGDDFIQ